MGRAFDLRLALSQVEVNTHARRRGVPACRFPPRPCRSRSTSSARRGRSRPHQMAGNLSQGPRSGQNQPLPSRRRRSRRRLSRAAHDVSVDRAPRHADDPRPERTLCAAVRRPGVSRRSDESGVARRRVCLGGGRASRRDARCRDSAGEAHSAPGRPWRRQQRRGRGAACARVGLARERTRRCARWRLRSAPTCRTFWRAARCWGWTAAIACTRSSIIGPAWVTLVAAAFGVSTADGIPVVGRGEPGRIRLRRSAPRRAGRALSGPPADLRNDLQDAVAARHPEIVRIVSALRRAGAFHAAMSGSGSAVFGLFASRRAADARRGAFGRRARDEAGGRIGRQANRVTHIVTRIVNRAAYQRLAAIPAHRINLPFAPRSPGHS